MLLLAVRLASVVSPSPSPSIPTNPYIDAVEEWPAPPDWMFVAVKVLAVVVGLVVLVTLAAAASSWRAKRSEAAQRPQTQWVDLAALDSRTSGVERRDVASNGDGARGGDVPSRDAEPTETGDGDTPAN